MVEVGLKNYYTKAETYNKQESVAKTDISDIEDIRTGADKGTSSVQSISMGVTAGNATAGQFFNVSKDTNGNVTISAITSTVEDGNNGFAYASDIKQYVDSAVANAGGGELPDLADVALSGDYNDLINKPTIPNGTITGVSANGTSVATSGVANIPAATTGKYGVTKLSSATNSTSTALAATPSAVKSAYDLANGKYTKPSTGIPFGDFEEQVQGSIIKAEESVQSVSVGVTTGNATAGNFFNVNKDANGNVSIQMIQNSLASGKTAIPYTTDVKAYVDNAISNAITNTLNTPV